MKKGNIVKPVGLKGNEVINRMKELMGSTSINENESGSVVELTKEGPDGKIYGVIRENHEYYIKTAENKSNLVTEDFNYIGGLQNKKDKSYPSYAKAIKMLNLKFMSLNEASGKTGKVNVFLDDNLITEHHGMKANATLSADKSFGDNDEYVVNKKGDDLEYDTNEDTKNHGSNIANGKVEADNEDVKLSENETAIDEMITGKEEVIEETMLRKYYVIDTTDNDKVVSNGAIHRHAALELANNLNQTKKGHKIKPDTPYDFSGGGNPGSVYEEKAKKGYSIGRAMMEMDSVIDELYGEDGKIETILESLGEDERAIMMEALKKKA
jgi:hypothetical protein